MVMAMGRIRGGGRALLLLLLGLLVGGGVLVVVVAAAGQEHHDDDDVLMTVLCAGFCDGHDCRAYETPLQGQCYNGQVLFPHDPSWGDGDFSDEVIPRDLDDDGEDDSRISSWMLRRTLFRTQNGTCAGDETDRWTLPLEECVGPFGQPRPWGKFYVMKSSPDDGQEEKQEVASY